MDKELEILRAKIDGLDKELLEILHKRFLTVEKIGEYKARNGLPVRQEGREAEVLKTRSEFCRIKNFDIDDVFLTELFGLIMAESVKKENR